MRPSLSLSWGLTGVWLNHKVQRTGHGVACAPQRAALPLCASGAHDAAPRR